MVLFLNSFRLSHSSSSRKILSFRIVENFLLRNVVWVRCVLLSLPAEPKELIVWLVRPRSVRALAANWLCLLALDFVFLREFDAVCLREPLLKVCEEVAVGISDLHLLTLRSVDFVSDFSLFNRRLVRFLK